MLNSRFCRTWIRRSGVACRLTHNGFFNVAMADGSLRTLKVGTDKKVLFSLAGFNDGDLLPPFE